MKSRGGVAFWNFCSQLGSHVNKNKKYSYWTKKKWSGDMADMELSPPPSPPKKKFGLDPCGGFWETWVYKWWMDYGCPCHDSSSVHTVKQSQKAQNYTNSRKNVILSVEHVETRIKIIRVPKPKFSASILPQSFRGISVGWYHTLCP